MVGQTLSYAYETPGRPDLYPASFFYNSHKIFLVIENQAIFFHVHDYATIFNTHLLNP